MRKSKDTKLTKLNRQDNSSNTYLMIGSESLILQKCKFELLSNILVEDLQVSVSIILQS